MFEFILDICPAVFAAGMIVTGFKMDKDRRESRAASVKERRQAEYAAEVEKAGERVRRLMAASAPLAGESGNAAEGAKPKMQLEVISSAKRCVVRRLPPGRREACLRELYCKF